MMDNGLLGDLLLDDELLGNLLANCMLLCVLLTEDKLLVYLQGCNISELVKPRERETTECWQLTVVSNPYCWLCFC
jgi:hypothetical protein